MCARLYCKTLQQGCWNERTQVSISVTSKSSENLSFIKQKNLTYFLVRHLELMSKKSLILLSFALLSLFLCREEELLFLLLCISKRDSTTGVVVVGKAATLAAARRLFAHYCSWKVSLI